MEIAPVHQLAAVLHASPRLMACVLGSGVSRAAEIPTGWEIVLDLVRRLAKLSGLELETEQHLLDWFVSLHGHPPEYSELVEALAAGDCLQRNVLEPYFTIIDDATQEHREREPTEAHRAIARLVARGSLRVIITTNFDRLMEIALREAGVAKLEVVSTAAQAANCYPFHASDAFIFKVHGDWRDVDMRNSAQALAAYPEPIELLLGRVLDEHGLIVCGWSAEYDGALRAAIERFNRRFPIYWVDPSPKDKAKRLCDSLKAHRVHATADQFFPELEGATSALERLGPSKRLQAEVLLLRATRAIDLGQQQRLDALVSDATRELTSWIEARTDGVPDHFEEQAAQLEAARRASEPLCKLAAAVAHYYEDPRPITIALSRLLAAAQKRQLWNTFADPIACYPAVLLGLTWGIMRADLRGWTDAIKALQDLSSRAGDLSFPPGSNRRMSPFRSPAYQGRYKDSPQEHWGNDTCEAIFQFCEQWIVRRGAFEELYDKLDLLIAVRSARINDWWIPRSMVNRGVSGEFAKFRHLFGEWLSELLKTDESFRTALFAGIDADWQQTLEKLRELAQEEQFRWRP